MLLTLTPPSETKLNLRNGPHDRSPPIRPLSACPPTNNSLASITSLRLLDRREDMSHQHRGLPPPAALSLPDPLRSHTNVNPGYGPVQNLPAAPSQWQGAEESMQTWLHAKAEEDRKRQEEERTKQEELRLSQRKIEAEMLRDSISGGIPPHLVPIIFAGLGGPALATAGLELAQQHLVSTIQFAQQQQQQQQQHQQQYYTASHQHQHQHQHPPQLHHGQQAASGQPAPPPSQSASNIYPSPAYQQSPRPKNTYGGGQQYSQQPPSHRLSRLTTSDVSTLTPQEGQDPSPNIFFHHWQPPSQHSAGAAKESTKEATGKTASPGASGPTFAADSTMLASSPRKRKAPADQRPTASASSPPGGPVGASVSPSFSVSSTMSNKVRKTGPHSRNESGESGRGYDPIRASRQLERRESSSRGTDSGSKAPTSRPQSPQAAAIVPPERPR